MRALGSRCQLIAAARAVAIASAAGSHRVARLRGTSPSSPIHGCDTATITTASATTFAATKPPNWRRRFGARTGAASASAKRPRVPYTASNATIASAGSSRRYAPTYQLGEVGSNEGSQPRGFTPRIWSSTSCPCCWKPSLRARAGIAQRTSVIAALTPMRRPLKIRIHQSRVTTSPYATRGAASGSTSTK